MPAQSQQQQKLFGLALAFKRGEVPSSEVSDEIKAIADRMSEKEIEDFAATKHKGLPKMKEQLRKIVREIMRERAISEMNEQSVNEAASRTAMEIGGLTGLNKDAIQKFVDDNNLDIENVFQFVKKGKLKDRMELVSAIAGKPNNPIQKKMIKMFQESVNEEIKVGSSVTVNYPTLKKPIKGKVAHILKSPTGLVYVLAGGRGVWDAKNVSLKESVDESVNDFFKLADLMISIRKYKKGTNKKDITKDVHDYFGVSGDLYKSNVVKLSNHIYKMLNEESTNEGISVSDERHFGKNGIIIMIDDNGKKVSAIFKDKKNADKYNRNNPSDIKKLLDLAKKTKYPKAIDESVNEESVNEGASTEEKRIVMMAIKKIAKYRNVPLNVAVVDTIRAAEELERTIKK